MGEVKALNIKNQTYHFFKDMINIQNFHSNLLKIDKTPYQGFHIYYIGYITIKKIGDCRNIHSVNPLYLMIPSATGYFTEENAEKYLILDAIDKYEKVFSGIKSKIEIINGGEEMYYENHFAKAGVNTDDDDIPLSKKIKFPSLTIIIRCVFQNGNKLQPQVYLDECLYEL